MRKIAVFALAALSFIFAFSNTANAAAISGRIFDKETGEAIAFATVQVVGTGKSTSANSDGSFRIVCGNGQQIVKVSHIGYFSTIDTVDVVDGVATRDMRLLKSVIIGQTQVVYDRQYDRAQEIIIEAIARKKEILERLGDYKYNSYTKMVVRDLSKEDSSKIMVITETQAQSFWERPDNYKEIITARKQSANMESADNLVSIGELLNFNKNRLEIGSYSVVSPVAEDALGYYNYYLLDSTSMDNHKVYKLEAEPKNQADALVAGYVFIADSSFDVVDVDLGFNKGVRLPFVKNLRYRQRVAQFENQYWMPIELRFTADVEVKFPGFPDKIGFEVAASLFDYSFETGHKEGTFDEYLFEVAPTADKFDSTTWVAGQTIPLSLQELRGYQRLDSLKRAPKSLGKRALNVGVGVAALLSPQAYNLFHFNRVEGAYAGFAGDIGATNHGLLLQAKAGYAFDAEIAQYRFGLRYQVPGKAKLAVKGEYMREVSQRPIANQGIYNSTFESLFFKYDPVSYFYQRGGKVGLEFVPIKHFQVEASVSDVKQGSLANSTDFSFFNGEDDYLVNASIDAGRLRLLTGSLEYDSRMLWRNQKRDERVWAPGYTTIKLTAELSSPDVLSSDFDYRRYYAKIERRQRTLGLGMTAIHLFAGASTRNVSAQALYSVADYDGVVAGNGAAFMTLGDERIIGDRAAYVYVNHEFRQYLFKKSGIPLVKLLPFTLGVHGGALWASFHNSTGPDDGRDFFEAKRPYSELGFSLGNLTPFLSLLNFGVYFTWQLSDYDTHSFVAGLGIKF
ncbi:MAG: DUF5686 family protein [Candidatus Zixiibacteriota bacterium]